MLARKLRSAAASCAAALCVLYAAVAVSAEAQPVPETSGSSWTRFSRASTGTRRTWRATSIGIPRRRCCSSASAGHDRSRDLARSPAGTPRFWLPLLQGSGAVLRGVLRHEWKKTPDALKQSETDYARMLAAAPDLYGKVVKTADHAGLRSRLHRRAVRTWCSRSATSTTGPRPAPPTPCSRRSTML